MSSYNPPLKVVPIFDTLLFTEDTTTGLTKAQADALYLQYPNAQGTENLQKVSQTLVGNNIQFGDSNTYNAITTGVDNISIGKSVGLGVSTGSNNVFIGEGVNTTGNPINSVSIGNLAGQDRQLDYNVGIGFKAGQLDQRENSVAIGREAGYKDQGTLGGLPGEEGNCIAIGRFAGSLNQRPNGIAIGSDAGTANPDPFAIALGYQAGRFNQGNSGISIGKEAGWQQQGVNGISIGTEAGRNDEGGNGICIGTRAGKNGCGIDTIIIGSMDGVADQSTTNTNNVIINATGTALASTGSSRTYIAPVRQIADAGTGRLVLIGATSNEIFSVDRNALIGPFSMTRTTGGTSNSILSLSTTDAGTLGSYLEIYKDTASPATNDDIGGITFQSRNAGASKVEYGRISVNLDDSTAGSVDATLNLQVYNNNTLSTYLSCNGVNNIVNIPKNVNITGLLNVCQTFDSIGIPFTNGWNASLGVSGTGQAFTINPKCQTSDPTIGSYTTGQGITNNQILGCALNLTAGVTYTGVALYFTGIGTGAQLYITIYNTGGIAQASSALTTIPAQPAKPLGFNLASTFTPTTSGIYFVCCQITSSTTTGLGATTNNMTNWQTPSVGSFNLRAGFVNKGTMGIYPNISTDTLTKSTWVPYMAMY